MPSVSDKARLRLERLKVRLIRQAQTRWRRIRGPQQVEEEVWLTTAEGYRVHAHLHRPAKGSGPWPGVVMIPGRDGLGTDFDGLGYPVSAEEIVALGAMVVHFDPTGLGRSWGEEDSSGPLQQGSFLAALEYLIGHPQVDRNHIGVLAISIGIAMAAPVLAREGKRLGVAFLVDWEGPPDRHVITAFGRFMAPAKGHSLQDDEYWIPREAVAHLGQIPCAYHRFQSQWDHAQGAYVRHAAEAINAALKGGGPSLVQLNDQPPGRTYDPDQMGQDVLHPPGEEEAHRRLLALVGRCLRE